MGSNHPGLPKDSFGSQGLRAPVVPHVCLVAQGRLQVHYDEAQNTPFIGSSSTAKQSFYVES